MEKPNINNHDEDNEDDEILFGYDPKKMYPDLADLKAWENVEKYPDQEETIENQQTTVENSKETNESPEAAKGPETKKEPERSIDEIREEVAKARKEYLEFDYKKNSALSRIRKFFGNFGKGKAEKQSEEDKEISAFKDYYNKQLFELQQKIMEDAKQRNMSDEELSKIYVEFRTEQKITLADEIDNVKAEQRFGSKWGQIGNKLASVIKSYRDQPLKKKLQISAAFFGATALAAGSGAALVAGAVGGAVIGRRIFMGMVTGYGVKKGLEMKGKLKEKKNIEKEKQKFLEKLKNCKDPEERFKLLNESIPKDEDFLKKIKNKNLRQNIIAGAAGFGVIFAGKIINAGQLGLEHFGVLHPDHIQGPGASGSGKMLDSSKIFPQDRLESMPPGNVNPAVLNENVNPAVPHGDINPAESPGISGHVENLTIKDGSSIEKTLIDNIKANHPEIKNPGAAAHRMWLDYMHENKDSLVKSIGNDGYESMLKDGMVNVKAGTSLNLIVDKNGLSLHNIGGNISHIEHSDFNPVDHNLIDHNPVTPEDAAVPHDQVIDNSATPEDVVSDQDTINEMKASSADLQSDIDKLQRFDKSIEALNAAPGNIVAEHNFVNTELHRLLSEKSILDIPNTRESAIEVKNKIFGKSIKIFSALKNENLAEVMQSEETKNAFLEKIPKGGKAFFNDLIKQVPPKPGDTTIRWITRVVIEAKK